MTAAVSTELYYGLFKVFKDRRTLVAHGTLHYVSTKLEQMKAKLSPRARNLGVQYQYFEIKKPREIVRPIYLP